MRLLPRDEKFFGLFISVAELSVEAAKLQFDLRRADGYHRGAIVDAIKRLEHEADQITHEVVTGLDRVFITPLDREDIHLLASRAWILTMPMSAVIAALSYLILSKRI